LPEIHPYKEKELLWEIAEGNERSFAILYRHYARTLLPFFRKFTRDESSANDMLQNTFLSIWLDRAKLPDIENLDGFVYKVAANRAYTWMAKLRSGERLDAIAASRAAPAQDITYQEVLFREAQKLVQEAVDEMPAKRKQIFQLYKEKGLKYNEIATQLNISASTARNAVAAALDSIRAKLLESGLYIFFILFFGSR
jgi:RNA polymerase sigma factor (sigma-70 family)